MTIRYAFSVDLKIRRFSLLRLRRFVVVLKYHHRHSHLKLSPCTSNNYCNNNSLFLAGIRVISVDDLRKKYRQFDDRKKLRKAFWHFLVDERVMQQVINLLGKVISFASKYLSHFQIHGRFSDYFRILAPDPTCLCLYDSRQSSPITSMR